MDLYVDRHILHICVIKNIKNLERLKILDRWRSSLIESEGSHFSNFIYISPIQSETQSTAIQINLRKKEDIINKKTQKSLVQESLENLINEPTDIRNFNIKTDNKGAPIKGKLTFYFYFKY